MANNDTAPRMLTPAERTKLRQEMTEAAFWMRAELQRRRDERDKQTSTATKQRQE